MSKPPIADVLSDNYALMTASTEELKQHWQKHEELKRQLYAALMSAARMRGTLSVIAEVWIAETWMTKAVMQEIAQKRLDAEAREVSE